MAAIHVGSAAFSPGFRTPAPLPYCKDDKSSAQENFDGPRDRLGSFWVLLGNEATEQGEDDDGGNDADDPAGEEAHAHALRLRGQEHENRGDDRDGADRNAERQRENLPDHGSHESFPSRGRRQSVTARNDDGSRPAPKRQMQLPRSGSSGHLSTQSLALAKTTRGNRRLVVR